MLKVHQRLWAAMATFRANSKYFDWVCGQRAKGCQAEKLQMLAETVSSTYDASEEHIRQNRKLLIDLGQFFEILEYSSSSEIPDSTGQLFGSSLQASLRGSRTEMAQTSVLPPPSRVERQEFGSATTTPVTTAQQTPAQSLATFPPDTFLAYSNDELAVLAESFFHQRQELDGNVNWWNSQFWTESQIHQRSCLHLRRLNHHAVVLII